ncbi:MAG TPA: DUF4388 domain-containing protein [Candidatus Polarisedimenticolia bacterium]|nr:DUF4388 domain-containing protein [Candidatus Polarisedimenticolia bacterium]
MGLSGTLSTFPLTDLLQWMGSARKTGTLAVRGERYTKKVFLKEGRIISSASDDPTEQLGQFLLSHGRISEEDLRKGLETQARTKVLLGKILLMIGRIEEPELRRLLVMKAEETIFSLFLWSDAHFEFADGELPDQVFVPIGLDVQDVLLKGVTIVDELRNVRRAFGSMATVLARTSKPVPPGQPPDRSIDRSVLSLVDGRRSIADICLALHASEFTVGRLLIGFLDRGYVAVSRREEARGPGRRTPDRPFVSPHALVARARERLARGDHDQALDLLHEALAVSPRDLEIKKLYDEAAEAFREDAYAHHLPPAKIPRLASALKDLTAEKLTPQEMFLISRMNGTWDLKSIIDISPIGEVEALRLMKKLVERRLIELE